MLAYYATQISPHQSKTPEGYLICQNVPINRTGSQIYLACELGLDGDPEQTVEVYRAPEDVFDVAAMASFEGKDVTNQHPEQFLDVGNQSIYSKGHVENVRRVGDTTVADLIIKDPTLISQIESGQMREVSCGYTCTYEPYGNGYKQTNIRGNHVAVVPKGRAGAAIAIQDAAKDAEKGRNKMAEILKGLLTALGMAAKNATPEELTQMVNDTAAVIDSTQTQAKEEPAEREKEPEPAPATETPEKASATSATDEKLDKILALLSGMNQPAKKELDIDDVIEKLSGGSDASGSVVVPAEPMEDKSCGMNKDSAIQMLRMLRPAVAAIQNKEDRTRMVESLLGMVGGGSMSQVMGAVNDTAASNAKTVNQTTYETMCAEAQSAYAARNPHTMKED